MNFRVISDAKTSTKRIQYLFICHILLLVELLVPFVPGRTSGSFHCFIVSVFLRNNYFHFQLS